jgi:outer membrane protein TolC
MRYLTPILALLASSLVAAESSPDGLTLARARELALESNPSIQQAAERIRAAEARLGQARSALLPRVSANATIRQFDIDQHSDDFPEKAASLSYDQYTFGIHGTWLIFNGYAREAAAAAKEGVTGAEEGRKEAERLIVKAVTVAFHQAQLARENTIIATRDQEFNETLEADARKRYEAQQVAEANVLNFRIRAIQAKTSRLAADRSFRLACTVLAELMALPNAELPPDLQPTRVAPEERGELPSLDGQIEVALRGRPDLRSLESGIRAAKEIVRATRGTRLPEVAFVAGADFDRESNLAPFTLNNQSQYVGLAATWELYTGGQRKHEIAEAKASLRELAQQRQSLILAIASELRQYHDTAQIALETLELQQEACELSARVRDDVAKAYQAGATSLTRLNEAQTDLVKAEGSLAAARILFHQVLEELRIATGRIR